MQITHMSMMWGGAVRVRQRRGVNLNHTHKDPHENSGCCVRNVDIVHVISRVCGICVESASFENFRV